MNITYFTYFIKIKKENFMNYFSKIQGGYRNLLKKWNKDNFAL